MAGYADDDIKNAAEIREWLTKLISEKQTELERLQIMLSLIDSVLKQGSFKTAANLNLNKTSFSNEKSSNAYSENKKENTNSSRIPSSFQKTQNESSQVLENRQIKRMRDNTLIAQFQISSDKIEIIPNDSITFTLDTPPFKSFFINRILDGMRNKDLDKVKQGQLSEIDILSFNIIQKDDNDNILHKIEIKNYRDKDRVNEIFNTVAWVFTRMLEKSER
ncbi:MAG: hypothetical protein ACTHKC_01460 [Candidatus Nitrosocosmicus sp.]